MKARHEILGLLFVFSLILLPSAHADTCADIPSKTIATYASTTVSVGAWCPGDGSLQQYVKVSAPDPNHPSGVNDVQLDNYAQDASNFVSIYNSQGQNQISTNDLVTCIARINSNGQLNAAQTAMLPSIDSELKAITYPVTPAVLAAIQEADVKVIALCLAAE